MRRMQQWLSAEHGDASEAYRRGYAQQPRRHVEQDLRSRIVLLSTALQKQGYSQRRQAEWFQLAPRTLRQWQHDDARQRSLPVLLGRPVRRAPVWQRNAVIALLEELGPGTGVPTLRDCFPQMQRAELADLLGRYRRVWRRRHQQAWRVLHWQVPGSVWAMDFYQAPAAIDGQFPYLLAVRDLASQQQLLWLPLAAADAANTCVALAGLFARSGAPLVLKSDNGSAFTAESTRVFLEQEGVVALFSPPYYPQYNGSIEAGIGSLATRSEQQAARHGRAGQWSYDDVASAQAAANARARPHGPTGPTPEQLWAGRTPTTAEQRTNFAQGLARQRLATRTLKGEPQYGPWGHQEERAMERLAIERALVEHGYLLFTRRRIPLPITRKKAAGIT